MNRFINPALGAVCAFLLQSVSAAPQPNIIVFLTDDQGYGDLGCYGSKDIATPNVDRLRAEGMKFDSFYVHNRCSPTRMAFMTGSHARRAGASKVIYRKDRTGINADEITVPELLRKAGYTTGMVGKWHLGEWPQFNPTLHGFDSFYGFMEYDDNKSTALFRDREMVEKVRGKTDGALSPRLLDAGIEFIRANRNKPFFLYYASPLPHTKWKPSREFAGTSQQGTYGDVVQEIDWQVGALMNSLEELNLARNTLFIFASDNGPQLNVKGHGSSGGLRDGKWTDFEGGIRVPCIMRWPATIPAGSSNNEITGIVDLLPTFCSIAQVELPTDRAIDGRNILPYLRGQKPDTPIHNTFVVPDAAIRHGDWKLLVKAQKPGANGNRGMQGRQPAKAGSLFNLKMDVGETTDVSEKHPEKVRELSRLMQAYMKDFNSNTRPIGRVD